ncbi:MAG: PilZ domain-containing protein [Afipia sp.]|nr:PilZ domain-containing protein [Afipia sp.]WIG49204.1 MAG: hypothetical protein OJF48_000119 [Afipia sp.]
MSKEQRAKPRVAFRHAFKSRIVASDGTRSTACLVLDISATGARVSISGALDPRIDSKNCFLVLTPNGTVRRRSRLIWSHGGQMGFEFLPDMPASAVSASKPAGRPLAMSNSAS